jgi:hypothetical protein
MSDLARADGKLSETLREMDPALLDLDEAFGPMLAIIEQAQARAYRAVNRELVGMYDEVPIRFGGLGSPDRCADVRADDAVQPEHEADRGPSP